MDPSFDLEGKTNILADIKKKIEKNYEIHTNTVATLFGKVFVRIATDAVIAAAKLIASATLTRKHIATNISPSGTWSNTLKENKTILKCKVGFNFFTF